MLEMGSDVTRRGFLGISGGAMLGGMLPAGAAQQGGSAPGSGSIQGSAPAPSAKGRPNIILFMPDEMRADSLACLGNPLTKTPNYDRLAAQGTKFSNCHVQYPVCGASRCSLLTGWPTSVRGHRSLYYFLRPEEPNLFRYLKESGYDVFWFGKNDALSAQCFYDSVTEWATSGPAAAPAGRGRAGGGARGGGAATTSAPAGSLTFLQGAGGDRRGTNDYSLLQAAIEVLERREQDRPFCIFLPMSQPHPPYTAPADFHDMYSPADVPAPIPPGLPGRPNFHDAIRDAYGLQRVPESTFRQIKAVYYGQVSYVDWLLGELMSAMERTNHAADTALFCLSDHGDYTGDFGLVEKWPSGLEDMLTHVPLLARVPGGTAGVHCQEMMELFDVMATCLDLAGVPARHTHFARSLMPQLSGQPGDPGRAAFSEGGYNVYEPQCFEPMGIGGLYAPKVTLQNEKPETISRSAMVRTRDAKLIVRPAGQSELYRYATDPHERENLYGENGAAALQEALQQRLVHWYINTTGIAPMDKDPRNPPPFYPSRRPPDAGWQRKWIDR
jgi:choline-sulfatase